MFANIIFTVVLGLKFCKSFFFQFSGKYLWLKPKTKQNRSVKVSIH